MTYLKKKIINNCTPRSFDPKKKMIYERKRKKKKDEGKHNTIFYYLFVNFTIFVSIKLSKF